VPAVGVDGVGVELELVGQYCRVRQVFADAPEAARGSTGPGSKCVGENLTHPTTIDL
jgi:hypothetical protein